MQRAEQKPFGKELENKSNAQGLQTSTTLFQPSWKWKITPLETKIIFHQRPHCPLFTIILGGKLIIM